jgi:hypothetical protein
MRPGANVSQTLKASRPHAAVHPGMPKLVVPGPALLVPKHLFVFVQGSVNIPKTTHALLLSTKPIHIQKAKRMSWNYSSLINRNPQRHPLDCQAN